MTTVPTTYVRYKPRPEDAPQPAEQLGCLALRRWGVWPIIVLLLLAHGSLIFHCAIEDFATFDEIGHLTAGLSYWRTGSYRLYGVNPPLPKLLGSLPVLLADPDMGALQIVQQTYPPSQRPEWKVGERFARDNASRYHEFVIRARLVGLLWSLLGAVGVYFWAKVLWGPGEDCCHWRSGAWSRTSLPMPICSLPTCRRPWPDCGRPICSVVI